MLKRLKERIFRRVRERKPGGGVVSVCVWFLTAVVVLDFYATAGNAQQQKKMKLMIGD